MSREISSVDTIVAEVASRLNVLSASEEDNIITDINGCTFDVQRTFPQAPFLQTSTAQTLSAGYSEYAGDSDFEKMYSILNITDDIKMTYLPPEQFDSLVVDATTSGSPAIYTIINGGTSIKYAPIPGQATDIVKRYQKLLGTVSAQSATPPLPTKYNELYCLYGEMKGLRRQQRYQEAREVKNDYDELKAIMIKDLSDMTSENIPIRSVREFKSSINDYGDPVKNIYGNN